MNEAGKDTHISAETVPSGIPKTEREFLEWMADKTLTPPLLAQAYLVKLSHRTLYLNKNNPDCTRQGSGNARRRHGEAGSDVRITVIRIGATTVSASFDLVSEDLIGLPAELVEQLSARWRPNKTPNKILSLIGDDGATRDDILIRMYRTYRVVMTRNAVIGHLFRLTKKGVLVYRRGRVYKITSHFRNATQSLTMR